MTTGVDRENWTRLISPRYLRQQVREQGIRRFLERFGYYALLFPLAVTLRLVLVALKPVVHVRFGRQLSYGFGNLGLSTELHMCRRDAKMQPARTFDIWYHFDDNAWSLAKKVSPRKAVCNEQLLTMWKRVIHINEAARTLDRLNRILAPGYRDFIVEIPHPWDHHRVLERFPSHLAFTKKEEERGLDMLQEMGVGPKDPYVCIYSRDSAYLDIARPWNPDVPNNRRPWNLQNSSIQNFELAARTLADLGYFVIRMGRHVKEPFQCDHPRVIDYASQYWSDFMDVFLPSRCTFFIGGSSGGGSLALVFKKPMVFVNFLPLAEIAYCQHYNSFLILKKHLSHKMGRLLTFREIIEHGLGNYDRDDPAKVEAFQSLELEVLENTPEEIQEAALEMHRRLDSDCVPDDNDMQLQQRFLSILREYPEVITLPAQHPRLKVGANFLKANRALLD